MARQSYSNHIRFYPPHHFIFYPVAIALLVISIYHSFTQPNSAIWIFISIIFLLLIALGFMLRQHYALTLQNRIIRLELRYRYFTLTGKRLEDFEHRLRDSQLFALRFASDDEFVALAKKAAEEKTVPRRIKKSITHWKGDYHRV